MNPIDEMYKYWKKKKTARFGGIDDNDNDSNGNDRGDDNTNITNDNNQRLGNYIN